MANAKPFKQVRKPADYVFGRPTLYRPEYCQVAIEHMGKGYSLTSLAGQLNVSKETVYAWIAAHADFSDAITRARAKRVGALEVKLLNTSMGVGVTAAIFALKNADPEEWKDMYNQTTNINVRVERLPDDELMRIAASGRAPLTIEHDASDAIPTASQPKSDRKSD